MALLDFKRVLCPVDLSGFSLDALKLAVEITRASGAALYVVHAVDNPFDELYMSSIAQADPAALGLYQRRPVKRAGIVAAIKGHSQVLLKQFAHDLVTSVEKVRYIVKTGNPLEAILEAAEERRADLIVLATHGRTGIKRLLIGNVAEKIVRHAPCPVLIVNARAARRRRRRAADR
jgi:universal stress protein A